MGGFGGDWGEAITPRSDTRLTLDLLGRKCPARFEGTSAEIVRTMNAAELIPEADDQEDMARLVCYSTMILKTAVDRYVLHATR